MCVKDRNADAAVEVAAAVLREKLSLKKTNKKKPDASTIKLVVDHFNSRHTRGSPSAE